MKKFIFSLLTVLMASAGFSQSAFDKYMDSDDVGVVVINKSMLGIVAEMSDANNKEAKDFIDMAKKIDEIKVFISNNAEATADMRSTLKGHLKKSSMEELMKVKDGDASVNFYIKSSTNDEVVNEFLMFVSGMDDKNKNFETVVVTMSGEIELSKVGALVNKLNLPDHMHKAHKKK